MGGGVLAGRGAKNPRCEVASLYLHFVPVCAMQDRTTVLVDAPFLVVCGAVHMQELMNALGQEDPLGLQERLLIIYDSTTFRASCDQPSFRKHAWSRGETEIAAERVGDEGHAEIVA